MNIQTVLRYRMVHKSLVGSFAAYIVFIMIPIVVADDWTQWRGNNRDGVWQEEDIVDEFDEESLKTLWRQPIGPGYTGPTVADGRLFVMDRHQRPEQTERVVCLDATNGKELWVHSYPAVYANVGYTAGPRASVTIDGDVAYSLGTMGHLHCLSTEDGSVIWSRELDSEYQISEKKRMPIWGISTSPLIFNDTVIIQLGAADACVVAFDKMTGKEKWRSLDDRGQYSSPILVERQGGPILLCWTGDAVAGLDPGTGEPHWRLPFTPTQMPIGVATPVVNGDMVFLTSFYDGSYMLKMSPDGKNAEKAWAAKGANEQQTKALHSMIGTPVWIGQHIYGVDSYGELRCIEAATGERIWENLDAVPRSRWSTIHFVQNGKDTWMFNERGDLILGRLTPDGLTQKSRANIIAPTTDQLRRRGGVCWSHPAYANKCIFVRNDKEIICVSLEK